MEDHTNDIAHGFNAFPPDTGQEMSLDFSPFAHEDFDFLGNSTPGPTTSADAARSNTSHDDSCVTQPACFSPYQQLFNPFDTPVGSRHIMNAYQDMSGGGMVFNNTHNHHQPHAHHMRIPHHMPQIQHHPQNHTNQRGMVRSASFSTPTPNFGLNGMPPGVMAAPHPAESCHQTTCESQSCPVRKDELAANALVSFTGGPQQPIDENAHTCCHFISPDENLFQFPVELPVWNHILSCHGQEQPSHCMRPCPAESPLVFRECHIPLQFTATTRQDGSQQKQSAHSWCGFKFSGPMDYIQHFNQYHRSVLPIAHEHHHSVLSPDLSAVDAQDTKSEVDLEEPPSHFTLTVETRYMCFWMDRHGHECKQNFKDGDELQKHVQEIHLKSLPREEDGYCCKWKGCNRKKPFGQRSKLARHIQTHTGYKSEVCHICGLKLSAKQSLAQHLLTHSGQKPWKCDYPGCNIYFRQQSALTMHRRTHTGEKPLQCEICGKCFSESSNLSKHRKIHRDDLPMKCEVDGCTKAFRRPDQLRRHIESHMRKEQKKQAASASPTANAKQAPSVEVQIRQQPYPTPRSRGGTPGAGRKVAIANGAVVSSSEDEVCGDGDCCFDEACVDSH
ncbi:metalloregulatory protein (zinc-responsiveness transcriptional activator) [Zalerion maritima]|uniref:Metalloregulatory protein (Zinc-responsiveness transcriptional activator) n=1 Tax=Zalerion maritima TaxID=339359 RepID=A0AAD5S684_9PEZI|nr:metalloregulatory protein (zinc-responsiveness transcriptional activator) [Zalerion maritima]